MEDAPYQLSRAAMRKRFGARAIDASAPQSERDTTPSGIAARRTQGGMQPSEQRQRDALTWRARFPQSQWAARSMPERQAQFTPEEAAQQADVGMGKRPLDLVRSRTAPKSPLDAIEQARATGAVTGEFATPYGKIAFGAGGNPAPSLMPEAPVEGVTEYLGSIAKTPFASLFSSLRPSRKPSILDGAQKWLQPV